MNSSDSDEQAKSWKVRAREMSEAKILLASFFGGAMLYLLIGSIFTLSKGQSVKSKAGNFVSTQGYIDSIYIGFGASTEGRDIAKQYYQANIFIEYSVNGKEYRTNYWNLKNDDSAMFESVEDSWKTVNRLAPNQTIFMNRKVATRSVCEFLLSKNLRSEITTPVEVKYDPDFPERNDWMLKNYQPSLLFFVIIFAGILIFLLAMIHATTKHRPLHSKILNWSFVLFIGLVTGPFFSGWEKVYAKLFPNHPLEPAQIIPFDERLDPKVCDALR